MTPSAETEVDDRAEVIGAPPSARILVEAGPGTGKTHTLLRRAQRLVDGYELEPASELLIFGFSRATVEAIAVRSQANPDLGRLPVRTVDSLASALLHDEGRDVTGSFDARIRAATSLVADGGGRERLGSVRHILVDEAQDVVGVRLDFVELLLHLVAQREESGFTVFGDQAQAIYDFQAFDGSPDNLIDRFDDESLSGEHLALTQNFRMEEDDLVELADTFGDLIRRSGSGALEVYEDLRAELEDRGGVTKATELAADINLETTNTTDGRSVAVLCRSNVEAHLIAKKLLDAELPVRMQHRAEDRGGAAWLSTLFAGSRFTKVKMPDEEAVTTANAPEDALAQLRRAGFAQGHQVDLARMAGLLRLRACPQELIAHSEAPITVSTIHRAKGLEFDLVYVLLDDRWPEEEDIEAEGRVLYVAATRAISELWWGAVPKLPGLPRKDSYTDRRFLCSWKKKGRPIAIEVRVSDSDPNWSGDSPEEHQMLQERLRVLVPGTPLRLELDRECDETFPVYAICCDAGIVGRTGDAFGRFVADKVWGTTPPTAIGLYADTPDTAALTPGQAAKVGIGEHGLHLRVRPFGLARLYWNGPDA